METEKLFLIIFESLPLRSKNIFCFENQESFQGFSPLSSFSFCLLRSISMIEAPGKNKDLQPIPRRRTYILYFSNSFFFVFAAIQYYFAAYYLQQLIILQTDRWELRFMSFVSLPSHWNISLVTITPPLYRFIENKKHSKRESTPSLTLYILLFLVD